MCKQTFECADNGGSGATSSSISTSFSTSVSELSKAEVDLGGIAAPRLYKVVLWVHLQDAEGKYRETSLERQRDKDKEIV